MANNNHMAGSNILMSGEEGRLEKQTLIEPLSYNSAATEEGRQNGIIDNQENNLLYNDDEQTSKATEPDLL